MNRKIIKNRIFLLLVAFFILFPFLALAYQGKPKTEFPKLANYYLTWHIPDHDVEDLAKWDLLVLDMEVQHNSLDNLKRIRQLNPDIMIFAYITSQEIKTDLWDQDYCSLRLDILNSIDEGWWLKDKEGRRVSFWPGTNMLNLSDGASLSNGKRWNQFLPEYIHSNVLDTELWDGVFYDNLWPTVSWLNGGNLDIDNDGRADSQSKIDNEWKEGNLKMLSLTGDLLGDDHLIAANSLNSGIYRPYLNGVMFESFPSPWEANGTWSGSMDSYSNDSALREPKVSMINSNMDNIDKMSDYRKMRFGLGSTLLGDGYYSFDYGTEEHSQVWWYDEYETELGKAISDPYNVLNKSSDRWQPGIWRRDFENGVVVVNSTKQDQAYVFDDEVFEKINGTQDRRVNNGAKVNMVAMMGRDAVIMRRTVDFKPIADSEEKKEEKGQAKDSASEIIKNKGFNNGAFVRVFNGEGRQVRNGFFTYKEEYPGNSQVLITDIDNDGKEEELVNHKGIISVYKNRTVLSRFQPYENRFSGDISFAVSDLDGDGILEIITGAGPGGGPHIRVFNKEGKPLIGGFFAYGRNFRGGVNVAVMDLNGDGTKEIITGAGTGGGPHVRVFSKDGIPLTGGFFAFDRSFRSGARIAIGNTDGAGEKEIIVGAGPGEPPKVRVFSKDGRLKNEFNAYDIGMKDGIMVIAADLDGNGADEILAGSLNY